MGVQRSALADVLEDLHDELQEEATRGDDQPLTAVAARAEPVEGPAEVRRRLREYLSDQAEKGKAVPMQRTSRGLHPTIRWTIRFVRPVAGDDKGQSRFRTGDLPLAERDPAGDRCK